jgi:hypothetical protein
MFSYPGSKVGSVEWCRKGQGREATSPNRPLCVNVYAGISLHGVTACHVVSGSSKHKGGYNNKQGKPAKNITSAEYGDVVMDTLLPEGCRLFAHKAISHWVFQQDNDPTHRVAPAVVKHYNKHFGTGVRVLSNWPPNSPDLNPIENVWAWAQAEVNKKGCATFEEFHQAVLDTVQSVPQSHLANLYASMPKRIARVISREGGKSGY